MAIIEVKNLGKKYNIGERQNYLALRDTLAYMIKSPLRWFGGKIKSLQGSSENDFWALKDINFSVEKGEVLGIIGRNGAGKSTLLKILSQITPPTTGEIRLGGRVGSLLEVGTGFHPELTGRENIYLNGAILGMRKKEIEKKFDEIVEFSGIGQFLDTPVKRYSSGMYVRLAFSVAAHLEPDILIIDEVLAVGDAEFQKKCLGKMEEVTKKQGRTVLFVSHNMSAVQSLCQRTVLLEKGKVKTIGPTEEVVAAYLQSPEKIEAVKTFTPDPAKKDAQILKIIISDFAGKPTTQLDASRPFFIDVQYELKTQLPAFVIVKLFSTALPGKYLLVSLSNDNNCENPTEPGTYNARVKFDPLLNAGVYSFLVGVAVQTLSYLDSVEEQDAIRLENTGGLPFPTAHHGRTDAIIVAPLAWQIKKIS